MNTGHIFSVINTVKAKNKPFKSLDFKNLNTATDFQG